MDVVSKIAVTIVECDGITYWRTDNGVWLEFGETPFSGVWIAGN